MSSSVEKNAHTIDQETRSLISDRYKRITEAVNRTFWGSDSDSAHSLYVGSYGRGTAIKTSDLDVLIELPDEQYERFTSSKGNGPSRLLQVVKESILATYPRTSVKGDGQVVVVSFSDGMVFEILPAFKSLYGSRWNGTYKYPDSHMGGRWLSTNPKAEQEKMKEINNKSNGLLYATCKHIRFVRDAYFSSYELSGILVDAFVSLNIGSWHFVRENERSTNRNQTYEEMLLMNYGTMSDGGLFIPTIHAPGSGDWVDSSKGWSTLGKVLEFMA